MASADEMERVIRDDQLDCPLVVDLRDVDFIDSTGLRRVLGLRNTALSNGQALALVPPGLAADRIFTLTGDMRSVQLADARLAKQGCEPAILGRGRRRSAGPAPPAGLLVSRFQAHDPRANRPQHRVAFIGRGLRFQLPGE
jgi:anti-anti-sigma factor